MAPIRTLVFCRQACSTVLLCALASAALTLPNTSRAPAHIAALPAASTNQSARSNTTTSITAPGATAAHSLPALQAATPAATQLAAAPTSPLQLLTHRGQSLFLTGMNLGNVQFLPFEGNPYGYTADQMRGILAGALRDIAATGSNSIRLWLHIDGSRSPAWGTKGNHTVVTGLPPGLLQDLKWVLRTAYETYGLLVSVALWSHDILAVRRLNGVANRARAILMMTNDDATAAYINTALLPMLSALKEPMWPAGPPYLDAVVAWEVLNEPEGISRYWRLYKTYMYYMRYGNYSWWNPNEFRLLRPRSANASLDKYGGHYIGWHFFQDDGTFNNYMYHDVFDNYPSEWDFLYTSILVSRTLVTEEVPYTKVLRFINRVAGAIHRAAPGAKVTVGVHSMPYATNVPMSGLKYYLGSDHAPKNYYSDAMLVSAGGDPLGTLDLFSVHGYPIWNEPVPDRNINMFLRPKAHWMLDKPVAVGEHWQQVMANPSLVTPDNYAFLHNSGYAGAWGWAWFNVTETYNYTTGAAIRRIDEHSCRRNLSHLLASLPPQLRYPVHKLQPPVSAAGAVSG